MDISKYTALEIGQKIKKKEITSVEVVRETFKAIEEKDSNIKAFITTDKIKAIAKAEEVDEKIRNGEDLSLLAGVPVCIGDNISTKERLTSCGSKMLSNYEPIFDSSVIKEIEKNDGVVIGKNNLPEFSIDNETETSFYGKSKNSWDLESDLLGVAAAIIAKGSLYGIGSDTKGELRIGASLSNLTSIKPTFGAVSRYGLISNASSFEQIGTIGKEVRDCGEILSIISRRDEKDVTTILEDGFDFKDCYELGIEGIKIGIPNEYYRNNIDEETKNAMEKAIKEYEDMGADISYIDLYETKEYGNISKYIVPAFYIMANAEMSANMSKYDGIKFGYSAEADSLINQYYNTRSEGFSYKTKLEIYLGSLVLSAGYYEDYYKKATEIRRLISGCIDEALKRVDVIITPVVNKNTDIDYDKNIYTIPANMAGLPALSLPCGFDNKGMPIGMQIMTKGFNEKALIKLGYNYQLNTDHHKKTPERIG